MFICIRHAVLMLIVQLDIASRVGGFALIGVQLCFRLDKHTLNSRQQTKRFMRFFNLMWIFLFATVESVR
jgi:hypothetical protein